MTASGQSVAFLREQLQPLTPVNPQRIASLITLLDNGDFQVRSKASRELAQLGDLIVPTLKKALSGRSSQETRIQVQRLLDRLASAELPPPDLMRALRAVEVLEQVGTPDARRALETLVKGTPDAKLTRDAKAALERMERVRKR